MPGRIGLTGQVSTPEEKELCMLPHILLGVGFQDAGDAEPKGAKSPADHRGVPPLTAIKIGKASQQVAIDSRSVIGAKDAMPGPDADRFPSCHLHTRGEQVKRFVPTGLPPGIFGTAVT